MIKHTAVLKASDTSRSLAASLALLAVAALFAGLCGSASAAKPVGKDGKIHTCYKAKGKAKGSLRVVPAGKKCMKGWRKLAWTAASTSISTSGQAGASGSSGTSSSQSSGTGGSNGGNGSDGGDGANGTNGTDSTAVLETKVATLSLKVDTLDGVLDGVTNGELNGVVKTLDGVTGAELSEALGTVPVLEDVCTQVSGLTGGLDSVNKGVKGLNILGGIGGISLGGLSLMPDDLLSSYDCKSL
jgi:hypothetical protein